MTPRSLTPPARWVATKSASCWKAAKHQALEEGWDLRDLIIQGLELVVKGRRKKGGK